MLERLASVVTRSPRRTLALWLCAIAALGAIGIGTSERVPFANVALEGTESARELDLREETFGRTATVSIVLEGRPSVLARDGRRLVSRLRSDDANHVLSPFDRLAGSDVLRAGSDRAVVVVVRSLRGGEEPADALDPVRRRMSLPGTQVRATVTGPVAVGERLNEISLASSERAQLLALPLLLLVLLLMFRSPVAALIPVVVGAATVAASTGVVRLGLELGAEFDVFAPTIASLMGLALGVDYSLLIVTRFRELATRGDQPRAAVAAAAMRSTLTAGRTVAHAGVVLGVAMICALLLAPGASLTSAAFAVLATAAVACASALVAVPAALMLLARHLDRWRIGSARRFRSPLGGATMARTHRAALAWLVPLLALTAIGLSLQSGPPTVTQLSEDEPTRAAIERVGSSFGVGWEAPLEVTAVAEGGRVTDRPTLARLVALQRRVQRLEGVRLVIGPADLADNLRRAAPSDDRTGAGALAAIAAARPKTYNAATVLVDAAELQAVRMFVVPTVRWGSPELASLRRLVIDELRDLEASGGFRAAVGGVAAETVEYDEIVSGRLPLLFAALVLTSLLILALLLRTFVVSFVTVALNVLTVGATVGVLSLLFVGDDPPLGGPGEIDSMALTMILIIVFALSIDYQVFLLGRMREQIPALGRPSRCDTYVATRQALRSTGPVVVGAALIMCTVFAAFAATEAIFLRHLGVGLTVAIVLDATIVRMILLPAALTLIGRDAWAAPPVLRFGLDPPPQPPT